MMGRSRLNELLAQYWDAAYQEGSEGRTHDTEDDKAQRILTEIQALFENSIVDAHMAGQAMSGEKPSYIKARAYGIQQSDKK